MATTDDDQTEGRADRNDGPAEPPLNWFDRRLERIELWLRTPDGLPVTALTILVVVWTVKFSQLVILRQNRYGSFDFDSGIFDQAAWLSAHGAQFDTVRGLPLYGHHATFGFYFFAPTYWLGFDGPTAMNVAQVVVLAAVPLIAYWVARRLRLEPWFACIASVVCLIHFSGSWLDQELFHPEVFAIAPLLAAYGFALRDQAKPYWVMLLAAIIWKEDVALAIIGMGVVLLLQRHRRLGIRTIVFGAAWFLIATQILLPHFSPTGRAFYAEGFYGDLGNNFTQVAWSFVRHPNLVIDHLRRAHTLGYLRDLWTPFGFVNLLAPTTLLIAIPQLFANLLSVNSFTWSLHFHYVALPLVASMIGFLIGLSKLRGNWRSFAAGVALTAAIATGLQWGVGPFSKNYRAGYWPIDPNPSQTELDHAVALIPGNASVSASYHLVPHLSSRELIFSFPNPWRGRNWGIGDRNQRDPRSVEWLIAMNADLGNDDQALLDQILSDQSAFRVVYKTSNVVVARRINTS